MRYIHFLGPEVSYTLSLPYYAQQMVHHDCCTDLVGKLPYGGCFVDL